jgi:hypothetical protein
VIESDKVFRPHIVQNHGNFGAFKAQHGACEYPLTLTDKFQCFICDISIKQRASVVERLGRTHVKFL